MPSVYSSEMKDAGIQPKSYGIRLDSGDLAYLSKKARVKMLDAAGFEDAVIAASNDLDEMSDQRSEDPGCSDHLLGCRHTSDHLQGLPFLRRRLQTGCHPE